MKRDLSPKYRFIFLLAFALPLELAGEQGTATGKLTLGGKTTPLTHAYALARPDTFDKTKENILVVLSDVAIPDEALWEDFPGLKMATAGRLHAVEIEFKPDRSVKAAGAVHEAFTDSLGYHGIPDPEFQVKAFNAQVVEGALSSGKPEELMKRPFEFSATFRAPILHRPAPTATGAGAAQTAPARVVLAFLAAAKAGDKGAIKKLLTAEYAKPLDTPLGKDILNAWKTSGPNPATTEMSTVDIRGASAEVVYTEKKGGGLAAKFTLVLQDGQWKIDGAMM